MSKGRTMDDDEKTPEYVMGQLLQCKTELGQQVEQLRLELTDHQQVVIDLLEDWNKFREDFAELLTIFRSGRGFFRVLGWIGTAAKWTIGLGAAVAAVWILITTGHWPGVGK